MPRISRGSQYIGSPSLMMVRHSLPTKDQAVLLPKTGLLILLSEGNALLHLVNKIHAYKLLDGSAILKYDWEIQHRCYLWYRAGF